MPSLASLLEDYRNWRGRQEWESGKGWQDFYNGDPVAQERAENMMGFGTGSHGISGLAGTFIGTKARTSDLKALDVAKQLEKAGEDPKKIWFDTGWFKAPWDKKWRSEISDAEMKATPANWSPTISGTNIQNTELSQAYLHPELYSAYPHLKEAELYANPTISSRARYETGPVGEDMISVQLDRPSATETLRDYYSRLTDPKSSDYWKKVAEEGYGEGDYPSHRAGLKDMLAHAKTVKQGLNELNQGLIYPSEYDMRFKSPVVHEIQHAIQDLEGFARGGSAEEFTRGGKINPETGVPYTKDEANALYERMGGEAEARLTQKRLKYPAGLRKLIFPLDELDVPLEEIYNPRNHVTLKTK